MEKIAHGNLLACVGGSLTTDVWVVVEDVGVGVVTMVVVDVVVVEAVEVSWNSSS